MTVYHHLPILPAARVSPLHAAILCLWGLDFQFLNYFRLVAKCIVHTCAWRNYPMSWAHIIRPKWQRGVETLEVLAVWHQCKVIKVRVFIMCHSMFNSNNKVVIFIDKTVVTTGRLICRNICMLSTEHNVDPNHVLAEMLLLEIQDRFNRFKMVYLTNEWYIKSAPYT